MLLQDYAGVVEKGELADRVKQAAAQGPQGQEAAVPAGYVYDPSSGAHAFITAHVSYMNSGMPRSLHE